MYITFLIVVTASLVATAAYFSVFGIASMFAYNYLPALIMGTTLEAGKIGVAVYLFRYWTLISGLFKTILVSFLVALMFITSVGIFGFLSQGYQKTAEEYKVLTLELSSLEQEFAVKKKREQEINRQIQELPSESVTNKIRLSREFGDELAELRDRLSVVEPRLQELRVKRLTYESHIGPISYVAKMLNLPQDNVVFYAIMMLVFVADPLAVTLTIAVNMVLVRFWEAGRPKTGMVSTPKFVENFVAKARTAAVNSYQGTFGAPKDEPASRSRPAPPARRPATAEMRATAPAASSIEATVEAPATAPAPRREPPARPAAAPRREPAAPKAPKPAPQPRAAALGRAVKKAVAKKAAVKKKVARKAAVKKAAVKKKVAKKAVAKKAVTKKAAVKKAVAKKAVTKKAAVKKKVAKKAVAKKVATKKAVKRAPVKKAAKKAATRKKAGRRR